MRFIFEHILLQRFSFCQQVFKCWLYQGCFSFTALTGTHCNFYAQ